MARKRLSVKFTQDEQAFLTTYGAYGQKRARYMNRARTLLLSHDGKEDQEIASLLGISRAMVYNIRKKYHQRTYAHSVEVLQDQHRPGRPMGFDSTVEATVTMMACSKAPKGAARWTLQLIADQLVPLTVVDAIAHESVRSLLKKTNFNLGYMNTGTSGRSRVPL